MAETHSPDEERRVGTQGIVDKWLAERQQMLVLYCQVAGLEPFEPDKPSKQLLKDYCQVLVDYMAFGHFEVYDRISQGEERRKAVLDIASEIYPRAVEVTELVVAFNDKYDTSDHEQEMGHLDKDLSVLGEELASLVEMEDRLVAVMQKQ
ncbi:MAG: Rsd/AlgQ family anti-sigma factor [Candidatus Sedimenticola sp. PURPLELP]